MNNILSWIFFGEMVVKLIGLGIKSYAIKKLSVIKHNKISRKLDVVIKEERIF